MTNRFRISTLPALALVLGFAAPLHAQDAGDGVSQDGESAQRPNRIGGRTRIDPYIEIANVANWQVSPDSDGVTYTQVAAGVDASIVGRNNGGTVSIRYERNFAHQRDGRDSDSITGIARGYASIVPNVLTVEAGALANRTSVDGTGRSVVANIPGDGFTTQTYSVYAGPNLQTRVENVDVSANYRIGYTKVDEPAIVTANGVGTDLFDESITQSANARVGFAPGDGLPVGVGAGAGFYQEDLSNLDQRVRDMYARADVTIPVQPTLAVVGGVGLEDVEVSSRDAVRDASGNPVVGSNGRYVTDKSSDRIIAYQADGLIWDVGVIWRPSKRTSLEAHFGHRYDSETYYGNFSWAPDRRSNLSIAAYDGIQGFGGRLNNSLANLPVDFVVVRDPVTGNITGCLNSLDGSGCLDGVLGSVRSSVFRGRGVSLSYSHQVGRMSAGIGAGYERRKFIGAPGTVLALANGLVDESYFVATTLSGPLGPDASFSVNSYANWFNSGSGDLGDAFALGSSASVTQRLWNRLSGRAAVALSMLDAKAAPNELVTASALLGLRYDF
jgi:hypothetical protein